MTDWIVKDEDYVPLPPHHVLRESVDWLLYEYWCCVYGMTGVKVCYSHARAACCLASDWPKELGPLPQQPEPRTSADDINELAIEDLKRENQQLREQCRRQADLIDQLKAQQSKVFESIEELTSKVLEINMW